MPTTKQKISEQILKLVGSGHHINEVKQLVGQAINKRLQVVHYNETMAGGERIPLGSMLATYDSIDVVSYAGRSRVELPAVPIELPKGVGVYQVVPVIDGVPDFGCEFIPIPPGQLWMIQKEGLLSDLGGMIGYERYGIQLLFSKDTTKLAAPVVKVLVRMAIVDISLLSDLDILPVPANMEVDIITDVYQILTGKKLQPNIVDPVAQKGVQ